MKTVRFSYAPDLSKIGTVAEVSDDEARTLIREGRAQLVDAVEADAVEATPEPAAEPADADAPAEDTKPKPVKVRAVPPTE